jgi:hypothetical protein
MSALLFSSPPPISAAWAVRFRDVLREMAPELSAEAALDIAAVGFRSTWLLEPDEAAELWFAAMRGHGWGAHA